MIVFSVYDTVAEQFGPLGTASTDGIAKRNFEQLMNTLVENPMIRKDYELWRIGTFDICTGEILPDKHLIITGLEYLPVKE